MVFTDNSKPSSDTSESGKETPSPRDDVGVPQGNKEKLNKNGESVTKEDQVSEEEVINEHDFSQDSLSFEENGKYPDDFEKENSDSSLEEGDNSVENNQSNFNDLPSELSSQKVHSGLSKSALARVKQRKMEEIRKRELSLIKQKEKEIEERLRAEKEAREAEERKRAEAEKRADEIRRLEELIKTEELKKQKEMLEKKKREEENEKRREEELKVAPSIKVLGI